MTSRQTRILANVIIGKLRRNEHHHNWEGYIKLPSWGECHIRWRIRDDQVVSRKQQRGKLEKPGISNLIIEDVAGVGPSLAQERAYSLLNDNGGVMRAHKGVAYVRVLSEIVPRKVGLQV